MSKSDTAQQMMEKDVLKWLNKPSSTQPEHYIEKVKEVPIDWQALNVFIVQQLPSLPLAKMPQAIGLIVAIRPLQISDNNFKDLFKQLKYHVLTRLDEEMDS